MKFVCDKCNTRYSIGEERVRGKILKIRCKNCGNVITVREGGDADASAARQSGAQAPVAAPAAAAPPPPPALQQEWYVSIDGVQSGPLSLTDAQKWVSSKPFEADLHCWSEGFDDWLSVDKVGHFRNLRKPRAPVKRPTTIPPPMPAKPLFASTMAALEKDAASASQPMAARPAVPSIPSARANGSGAVPQAAKSSASGPTPARTSTPSGRFNAQKGPGHAALAAAFDPGEDGDSRTSTDAPAFDLAGAASAKPNDPFSALDNKPKTVQQSLDDDDELSIGEVSRVVNLADLVPKPKPLPSASPATDPMRRNTGSVQRIGAGTNSNPRVSGLNRTSQPRFSPTDLGMNVDPSLVAQSGIAPDESMVAQSFAHRHRRGMIALLAFAGLLVAGVAGLLMYITSQQSDEIGGGLGGGPRTIDTSRPEDIVRRQLPPVPDTGSASTQTQVKPKWTGTRPNPNTNPQVDDDPKGLNLKASEIEDMASKQGEGTKRCYMRAQKGALGFEIANLKKIEVTLTVGKDGAVSTVNLSSHSTDVFGTCLIARIKAWRFRESPSGGTFRISLAFSS